MSYFVVISSFVTGLYELSQSLSKKRPYIVLGCFVVGMLLTPPDVISQSLLAIPMYLLYEVGLLFGRLVRKRRAEADAEDQES